MRITPDTDLDADDLGVDANRTDAPHTTSDGSADAIDRRAKRRISAARSHRLQRNARRMTKEWDITVQINKAHRTAHINMERDPPCIIISGREFPQPLTDYDPEAWDWLCQRVLNAHESAHERYTNHDDFVTRLDDIDTQYKSFAKQVWNALEDGAIERQLRERWPNYSILILHFRANLFESGDPGRPNPDGSGRLISFAEAVVLGCLDNTTYDSHTLRSLVDPDDDTYQFVSEDDRTLFLQILPDLHDAVDDVLTTSHGARRNKRIFEFIDTVLDVLPDADDDGLDDMDSEDGPGGMPNDADNQMSGSNDRADELDDDLSGAPDDENDDLDATGSGSVTVPDTDDEDDEDDDGSEEGDGSDEPHDETDDGTGAGDGEKDDSDEDTDTATGGGAEDSNASDDEDDADDTDGSSGGSEDNDGDDDSDATDEDDDGQEETTDGRDTSEPSEGEDDGDDTDEDGESAANDDSDDATDQDQPTRAQGSVDDIETDADTQESLAEDLRREEGETRDNQQESDREAKALADELNTLSKSLSAGSKDLQSTSLEYIDESSLQADTGLWDEAEDMAERIKHLLPLDDWKDVRVRRHQRRGRLDSSSLHRVVTGSKHIKKQRTRPDDPNLNVVLVLDRSASMSGGKVKTAEMALLAFALALEHHGVDVMVIELYGDTARLACPFTQPLHRRKAALTHGKVSGSTPLSDTLVIARERLKLEREGINRVIMVTDDEPNDADRYTDVLDTCSFPVAGITIRPDGKGDGAGSEYYHRSMQAKPDGADLRRAMLDLARELFPREKPR